MTPARGWNVWNTKGDGDRIARHTCTHPDLVETPFAGLGRTLCRDCGLVSVSYLHDMFEEENRQLDAVIMASEASLRPQA